MCCDYSLILHLRYSSRRIGTMLLLVAWITGKSTRVHIMKREGSERHIKKSLALRSRNRKIYTPSKYTVPIEWLVGQDYWGPTNQQRTVPLLGCIFSCSMIIKAKVGRAVPPPCSLSWYIKGTAQSTETPSLPCLPCAPSMHIIISRSLLNSKLVSRSRKAPAAKRRQWRARRCSPGCWSLISRVRSMVLPRPVDEAIHTFTAFQGTGRRLVPLLQFLIERSLRGSCRC